jgi:hypothetical protein
MYRERWSDSRIQIRRYYQRDQALNAKPGILRHCGKPAVITMASNIRYSKNLAKYSGRTPSDQGSVGNRFGRDRR